MTVYLQRQDVNSAEFNALYTHCVLERIPVKYFTVGDDCAFDDCTLVSGSVEAMVYVFDKLKIEVPLPNYYPECINHHLHRTVQLGSVHEVIKKLAFGVPVFAKSVQWKLITGQVFDHQHGFWELNNVSSDTAMFMSDCVEFVSEYRVYVTDKHQYEIAEYIGDDTLFPDEIVITDIIHNLNQLYPQRSCFVFDVGILSTGQTALVEVNDAWAIGLYKPVSPKLYFKLLQDRWLELYETRRQ